MQAAQHTGGQSRKRNTKPVDTKVYQDIIERLDKFFGEVPYKLEWTKARNGREGVRITYTDFFSERLVRSMLQDVLPPEIRYEVKREYSDKAIARILLDEYKKNRVAIVDCYEGKLRPETIKGFVDCKLDTIEML